jgi:hypothetical protein
MKGNKHNSILKKKRFLGFNKDGKKIYKTKPHKNNKSKGGWGNWRWGQGPSLGVRKDLQIAHDRTQEMLMKERMAKNRETFDYRPTEYDRDKDGHLTSTGVIQMRSDQSKMQVIGPHLGTYQRELKKRRGDQRTLQEFYGEFHKKMKSKGYDHLSEQEALERVTYDAHHKIEEQKKEEAKKLREKQISMEYDPKKEMSDWLKQRKKDEDAASEARIKQEEQEKWDNFTKSVKNIPTNIQNFGENTIGEIGKLPTTIADHTIGPKSIFTNFKNFFTSSNGGKKRIPKKTVQKKKIPKETVQKRIPKEILQKRLPKEILQKRLPKKTVQKKKYQRKLYKKEYQRKLYKKKEYQRKLYKKEYQRKLYKKEYQRKLIK